jgi:hypothetical protein
MSAMTIHAKRTGWRRITRCGIERRVRRSWPQPFALTTRVELVTCRSCQRLLQRRAQTEGR